jgi:hypothetical protein
VSALPLPSFPRKRESRLKPRVWTPAFAGVTNGAGVTWWLLVAALACAPAARAPSTEQAPAAPTLARAHAHNDYEHARPLLDALDRGFASVEADVHLVGGALLVAHDRDSVVAGRTLERLYLDPLRERARRHGGRVYADGTPLLLLVDVKSDSTATWPVLERVLARYDDLVTAFRGDTVVERAVLAVVSGNRAIGAMRAAPVRHAAVDGRLADLGRGPAGDPPSLIPLVSDTWERITKWKGNGPMPGDVPAALARAVSRAHAEGRRLRFWATPDRPVVWRLLVDAGVDLVGADDLDALRDFLLRQPARGATR